MTTLTLLTKTRDNKQKKQLQEFLESNLGGLEVEAKILDTAIGGWAQISLLGEDEEIAQNYLIQEVGLCPESLDKVTKFSTIKGYINDFKRNTDDLSVDVGIFQPKTCQAIIPLFNLQTELAFGRKVDLEKIVDLFGLCEGLPLLVIVNRIEENENHIRARLSNEQISKYNVWKESLLQRLLVINPSHQEIMVSLKHSKLYRDIIDVESLGVFEHSLTCKLGTDAAGLIPKIGKNLKYAKFAIFNPLILRDLFKK